MFPSPRHPLALAVGTLALSVGLLAPSGAAVATTTSSTSTHAPPAGAIQKTGLCSLVAASVVATILNTNMELPISKVRPTTTECFYRSKVEASTAVLIRFDTRDSGTRFTEDRRVFKSHGQKVSPVTGLGDAAYYFGDSVKGAPVTTVVARQGGLMILVTGTGTLAAMASVTHVALTQAETLDHAAIAAAP